MIIRLFPCLPLLLLASCRTAEFYTQAVAGQMEILRKSRPIPPLLEDPGVDLGLKRQLASVQDIREFASGHLSLPGSESYGKYADLGREYVSWVIYAAPEFSLKPKTWWYPTLGYLDYRGFFDESDARKAADELREQGFDVDVVGVDAYSTLGWFHDPVLNCFIGDSDVDLAELIFHELTHRKLFRAGDTAFNEALATAYSEEGVRRWLKHQGRSGDLIRYQELLVKRNEFYDEIEITRGRLESLYASAVPEDEMRRAKAALLKGLQNRLRVLRRRWGGRGLESWLGQDLNNAHLVSIITYQQHGKVFHNLLRDCGGDPGEFFARARKLRLTSGENPAAEKPIRFSRGGRRF